MEDDEDVEELLRDGELEPEWKDYRDYKYADLSCNLQEMLVRAFSLTEDSKALREAKKTAEMLVINCRMIKRKCREDIEKA